MRKLAIAAAALAGFGLAACETPHQAAFTGAAIGAGTGALIGSAVGDTGGAVAGAVVGGVAGAIIGRATHPGQCYARDRFGRTVVVACPPGYW